MSLLLQRASRGERLESPPMPDVVLPASLGPLLQADHRRFSKQHIVHRNHHAPEPPPQEKVSAHSVSRKKLVPRHSKLFMKRERPGPSMTKSHKRFVSGSQ